MQPNKPTETRTAMAEGVAKAPEGIRPWEDCTLSATERYESYDKVVRERPLIEKFSGFKCGSPAL